MRLPAVLLSLLVAVQMVSAQRADAQGRATAVGVATVEIRTLSETVPVFAQVVTARDGAVASRVAGNVEQVHVLAGTYVNEGDLLVELNRELLAILVSQSEAQLAEAEAGIATARVRVNAFRPCAAPAPLARGGLMMHRQTCLRRGRNWPRRRPERKAANRGWLKPDTSWNAAASPPPFPAW